MARWKRPCAGSEPDCCPGAEAGRPHPGADAQYLRLRPGLFRRDCRRPRADSGLRTAFGAGDRLFPRGLRRPGDRLVRGARPARGPGGYRSHRARGSRDPEGDATRWIRRYGGRRPGLSGLHIRHIGQTEGRAPCPQSGLGPAADVPGLVRHRTGRCHGPCRSVQLDLYVGCRNFRPMGQWGHECALYRAARHSGMAGADRRLWWNDICRCANGLSTASKVLRDHAGFDAEPAPRPDGGRGADAGGRPGMARALRTGALRGARHDRGLDLYLVLADGADPTRFAGQAAGRPLRRDPADRRRHRAAAVRRGRPARAPPLGPGDDDRLLEPAGRDAEVFAASGSAAAISPGWTRTAMSGSRAATTT